MFRVSASALVLAASLSGCAASAQAPAASQPLAATAPLSACFDAQARIVPFSGVALVARGDDVLVRTAGHADLAGTVPIRRDTRFRTGSVTKVMIRAAIARLADQGRLALDHPVGRHVPDLPPEIAAVTIDQLLQHRSGLGTYMRPGALPVVERARTAGDLLPLIREERPAFPPGSRERYSNSGYVLLGAVIEGLSGRDWGEYLAAEIFGPLGMASTTLDAAEAMAEPLTRLAGPGQPLLDEPRIAGRSLTGRATPAGNLVTTVDDLLRFGRALAGDRLVSARTKARVFPRDGDVWRIGQAGGTSGVNADFSVLPESGWIIAVLTNRDPPAGEIMGEVLRTAAAGRGCTTLTEENRPSPMGPPAPAGPGGG